MPSNFCLYVKTGPKHPEKRHLIQIDILLLNKSRYFVIYKIGLNKKSKNAAFKTN